MVDVASTSVGEEPFKENVSAVGSPLWILKQKLALTQSDE